jgi:hypothetical protein
MVDTANGNVYGRLVYDNNYFIYKPNSGIAAFTVDPSGNFSIAGTLSAGNTTLTGTSALTVNRSGSQGQITLQNNGTNTGILIAGVTNGLVFYDAAAGLQMGTWAYSAGLAVTGSVSATGVVSSSVGLSTYLAGGTNYVRLGTANYGFKIETPADNATLVIRRDDGSSGNIATFFLGGLSITGNTSSYSAGKGTFTGIDVSPYAQGVGGTLDLGGNYRSANDASAFVRIAAEKTNGTNADYGYNMGFYVTTNNGSTMGTKAMTILSNAYVGIGTNGPSDLLHLDNGTLRISGSTAKAIYLYGGAGVKPYIDLNEFGVSDYYIGVGTTTSGLMTLNASLGGQTGLHIVATSGNVLFKCTSTPSATVFGSGFIDNSVGAAVLYQSTTLTTANALQVFYNPNGNVGSVYTSGSSTTYSTSSDYRLKENIAPMVGALATVSQLKPCTYTWKADGSNGQGFIAHELQAVVSDAVVGEKDAVDEDGNIKPQGIDTSFLVATLTAAIQEQQAIIELLKARLDAANL